MNKIQHVSSQRQMIIQDKLVKEQNDAKNAVEEYVYDLRDKLSGVYEKYITEDVSEDLLTWLICVLQRLENKHIKQLVVRFVKLGQ